FGRKKATYAFIIANAVFNILLCVLISIDMDAELQQTLFAVLRLLTGIASNVYALAAVLAMEIVGTSKRVTAVNTIYYIFIAGEFIVLLFAYFIRNFRIFYTCCTIFMSTFILYFWMVPESPRWLMTSKKFDKAYQVFKRIAKSNKRKFDGLVELEDLKQKSQEQFKKDQGEHIQLTERLSPSDQAVANHLSVLGTIKIFFKSKKLLVRSISILINWLTNTLVYYGISFNTSELVGDPYLNFGLSIFVELAAILVTHVTLERFGRKIPYAINMALTGISLLSVIFIPPKLGWMVTACALIGKFSISFTYNTIYIITGESHPTVIRNSVISVCQSFARLGAIIAPNIQYLGELFWFPIPFIVYGAFSTLSAICFILFIPETKFTNLPDTIEEFIES
ncbi:organic cation transporter, partial [Brachionus plicatilis]